MSKPEEQVQNEKEELKTETDSMKDTTQTLPRQPADNEKTPRKTAKRHLKDTQKTENPKENNNSVSEEVSEPKPRKEITQANLEQATAIMEIAEQLASGRSVREVVKEMGFSKTLVEKVSSGMDRSQHIHPKSARAEYLEKPYRVMMEKEERSQSQNFLSDKISSMVEDALLLSLQVQVYRDVLGLGGKQKNGDDLFEKMMLAKVVGGGQSLSGKELIEFASALKTVLTPQQSENFLDKYVQLEGIKNQSIDKYKAMQNDAFQQAKQSMDKGLLHEAIHEFGPTLNNLTKGLGAVKIPSPTAPAPEMPPPLEMPQGEILGVSGQELEKLSLSENQGGYNNLDSFRRKTKL